MINQYVGKLVYDDAWGVGLITKKTRHDRYEVWWYDNPPDREWKGEVTREYIIRFDAKKHIECLDSSDGRAAPL